MYLSTLEDMIMKSFDTTREKQSRFLVKERYNEKLSLEEKEQTEI
jgi:hypothetical protein